MPNVIESDDFNPKKIADDLFERCRKAKAWYVYCYIDESWTGSIKPFPFEMEIVDGVVGCRVICSTYTEAQKIVADYLPVIKFIIEPDEDGNL